MTPGLPFVPAIAVIVNIYLIFKLSILTLVRFTVWMAIGRPQLQCMSITFEPNIFPLFFFCFFNYRVLHPVARNINCK
jgi:hypothetical protein